MDTSGQAAEQIVRYSMEGMEYTLRVAGKGTERLAAALLALSQSQQKTKGKTTLHAPVSYTHLDVYKRQGTS